MCHFPHGPEIIWIFILLRNIISQMYLAIISTDTSSASQTIFIFIKHEMDLWGEAHHKISSIGLGRTP